MRFRILGPPVEQICLVEGKHSDKFEKIFKKIEKALKYKGKLWDEFQLHTGRQIEGTKRVEALPTIVKPTDTPDSLQLTQDKKDPPLLFILRPKGAPLANTPSKVQDIPSQQGSVPNTPGEATPASTPRREATPGATDSNVVSPAPVTTPAAKSETTVPNPGASYFDRLTAIYTKYEPSKLSKVNGTLKRFAGREEEVIQQLVKLYGPEPVIEAPASKVETPPKAAEPPQQQPAPRTPTPEKAAVPEESPHSEPQVSPPTSPASQGMDADTLTHTPRSTSLSSPTHETVNEAYTYHDRLRAIYTVHDPPKVSAVDGTLKKYKGKEEAVIRQLVKKYGSEPIIGVDVQLSHTDKAYRDRLTAIYQKYDPSKLHTVEGTLQKFKGKEEQVIKKLVERYGPEPVAAEERDVSEYRKKITEIIEQHDPENLHMVEPLLENFVGREDEIIKKLNEKYAIGEPKEEEEKPQEKQEQKPVEEVKKERTPPVTPVVSFVAASPLRSTESKPVEGMEASIGEAPVSPPPQPPMQFIKDTSIPDKVESENAPPVVVVTEPTSPASEEEHHSDMEEPPVEEVPRRIISPPLERREQALESSLPRDSPLPAKVDKPLEVERNVSRAAIEPQPKTSGALQNKTAVALADLVEARNRKSQATRILTAWINLHFTSKARKLLKDEVVWKQSGNRAVMVDDAKPSYAVDDLVQHLRSNATSAGLPDEVVAGLREVIEGVKQCLSASVVEVNNDKDKEMVDKLLAEWSDQRNMCPVRNSENLLLVLKQAARFLRQVEDIMGISKRQNRQLIELTEELRALKKKLGPAAAQAPVSSELQQQFERVLQEKERLQQELENVYNSVAYKTSPARSPRGVQAGGQRSPRYAAPRGATSPRGGDTQRDKDAHIAKLEQELAKARTALFKRKEANDELLKKLEESERCQQRLQRDVRRTSSRQGSPVSRYRSRSQPNDISISPITKIRPSMFSEPSPVRGGNTGEVNSPAPTSGGRLSADMRMERGPCPNCLAPLTSVSTLERGPIDDTAAFCFNCRKPFTFGDLLVRDKIASAYS